MKEGVFLFWFLAIGGGVLIGFYAVHQYANHKAQQLGEPTDDEEDGREDLDGDGNWDRQIIDIDNDNNNSSNDEPSETEDAISDGDSDAETHHEDVITLGDDDQDSRSSETDEDYIAFG